MSNQSILKLLSRIIPVRVAHAHCDVPCGIYDPHQAQIGALTVIRMMDIIADLQKAHPEQDAHYDHDMSRAVSVKEEHAELVKREVRILWGDYFKAEHMEKFPNLNVLTHEIMQLASKSRQSMDRDSAMQLLSKVNEFAELFWRSKGKETRRVKAPYKPEEEIVIPVL